MPWPDCAILRSTWSTLLDTAMIRFLTAGVRITTHIKHYSSWMLRTGLMPSSDTTLQSVILLANCEAFIQPDSKTSEPNIAA